MRKVYQVFSSRLGALANCILTDNEEWENKHEEAIRALTSGLPCGSGFDNGSFLSFSESTPERLVFLTSFHHMNENGMYTKWSEHRVIVTPSLQFGIDIKVTGRNVNDIKDYIGEMFDHALTADTAI